MRLMWLIGLRGLMRLMGLMSYLRPIPLSSNEESYEGQHSKDEGGNGNSTVVAVHMTPS
jgi:hypothetical protein